MTPDWFYLDQANWIIAGRGAKRAASFPREFKQEIMVVPDIDLMSR